MNFTMYDEFDFDLMSETTYDVIVCIVATCIIAVLIMTPIKKRSHSAYVLDHHMEESAYPVFHDDDEHEHNKPIVYGIPDHIMKELLQSPSDSDSEGYIILSNKNTFTKKGDVIELMNHVPADDIPIDVIKACTGDITYPARKIPSDLNPKKGTVIELMNHVPADDIPIEVIKAPQSLGIACPPEGGTQCPARTGDITYPAKTIQSPLEEAICVMKKSKTKPTLVQQPTLRIPLKYKTAEIIVSPTTLGTFDSDPNKKYGSENIVVDKVTIKCHFAKSLLVPTNKYIDVFTNIIAWLNTIGYNASLDIIIQQDNDIEFDQKAVNARQAIITTHIATLKATYTVNQMYGVVTPKVNAKAK